MFSRLAGWALCAAFPLPVRSARAAVAFRQFGPVRRVCGVWVVSAPLSEFGAVGRGLTRLCFRAGL